MQLDFIQDIKCPYCGHPFDRCKYKPLIICHQKHILCQICVIKSNKNANCPTCKNNPILFQQATVSINLYKQLPSMKGQTNPPQVDPHVFLKNQKPQKQSIYQILKDLKPRTQQKSNKNDINDRNKDRDMNALLSAQNMQKDGAISLVFKGKVPEEKKEECKCPCNCDSPQWMLVNYIFFALTQVITIGGNSMVVFGQSTSQCTFVQVYQGMSLRAQLILIGSFQLLYLILLPVMVFLYKKKLKYSCGCCVVVFKILVVVYFLQFLFNIISLLFYLASATWSCPVGVTIFIAFQLGMFLVRPVFLGIILRVIIDR